MGLQRSLSLAEGIPLAIGSLIGSGVLFLPSLTYTLAGPDVMLVWLVTTILSLPLMVMFRDMVDQIPNEEAGLEGFVSLGLGKTVGGCVPALFVFLTCFGMPSAALVAGSYVARFTGGGELHKYLAAAALLSLGFVSNLAGARMGARVQQVITAVLFVTGVYFFFATFGEARGNYDKLAPAFEIQPILQGMIVAFWAFAGFENLAVMVGEFKNPRRDFPIAMLVALVFSGVFHFALTANYAAIVPLAEVSDMGGLYQLAERASRPGAAVATLTAFGVLAVAVFQVSWFWGMSRAVYGAARGGKLPRYFATLSARSIPTRAIMGLGVAYFAVLLLSILEPRGVRVMVEFASSMFTLLYLLCVLSYLRFAKGVVRRGMAVVLLVVLVPMAVQAGWRMVGGLAFMLATYLVMRLGRGATAAEATSAAPGDDPA